MTGRAITAAVLAVAAGALAACGANNPTSATAGLATTLSAPASRLLVVADPSPYSGAGGSVTVVRFFTLDGQEASHVSLPTSSQILAVAGARVFVLDSTGKLRALHRNGTYEDLADLGGTGLPFVASPDGKRWVWSTATWQGQTITSAVHLGGDGLTPRIVETVTEDNRSLQPYEWTPVGLFIAHGAVGIGGYIPYLGATGPVDRVDVGAGTVTPVAGNATCGFSDMSPDGTTACFPAQHTVRIRYPDGRVIDIPLSTPRFNLTGDAYFSHDGQTLTVAGAVGAGFQGGEHYGTDVIKTSDASITRISLDGVRPAEFMRAACWLSDGSLVVYRAENSADGQGTFVYSAAGKSTLITKSGMPVGILTG